MFHTAFDTVAVLSGAEKLFSHTIQRKMKNATAFSRRRLIYAQEASGFGALWQEVRNRERYPVFLRICQRRRFSGEVEKLLKAATLMHGGGSSSAQTF